MNSVTLKYLVDDLLNIAEITDKDHIKKIKGFLLRRGRFSKKIHYVKGFIIGQSLLIIGQKVSRIQDIVFLSNSNHCEFGRLSSSSKLRY